MDTTPIKARLSVIARCVNALRTLKNLAYDEFARDYILKWYGARPKVGDAVCNHDRLYLDKSDKICKIPIKFF